MTHIIIPLKKLTQPEIEKIVSAKNAKNNIRLSIAADPDEAIPLKLVMILNDNNIPYSVLDLSEGIEKIIFNLGFAASQIKGNDSEIICIGDLLSPLKLPFITENGVKIKSMASLTRIGRSSPSKETSAAKSAPAKANADTKTSAAPKKPAAKKSTPKTDTQDKELQCPPKKQLSLPKPAKAPSTKKGADPFFLKITEYIPNATKEDCEKIKTAFEKSEMDFVLDMQMRLVLGTKKGNSFAASLMPHFNEIKKLV